jgi:hypothetical protein
MDKLNSDLSSRLTKSAQWLSIWSETVQEHRQGAFNVAVANLYKKEITGVAPDFNKLEGVTNRPCK